MNVSRKILNNWFRMLSLKSLTQYIDYIYFKMHRLKEILNVVEKDYHDDLGPVGESFPK